MNILIPDSWLREYLATKAKPKKIARCLSLCGASVERLIKSKDDWIYDIEITSNRVDMASVAGIAREAAAILPQFGIPAKLKKEPYQEHKKKNLKLKVKTKIPQLKVIIKNQSLCPRFTAVLLDNVKVKPSSKIIRQRLEKVGLRSLNNVIDISNYLMHKLGQPVHVFDYDKIKKAVIIVRESKKGEKITTLDAKTHVLPGKDIVIEDGSGHLIDLCGIMGGQNSAVDGKTKRVLLFVQNYEPGHIRKTSMNLAQRTEAANLFEKQVDSELVMSTLIQGVQLIKKQAEAKMASQIIDIYPQPYKPKTIKITLQLIKLYLGLPIQLNKVIKILQSLGFKTEATADKSQLLVTVPSWRIKDVSIPEDLIEEIARIYGYRNLPSQLPSGQLPSRPTNQTYELESKVKNCLSNWGYTETYTYSMQSKDQIKNCLLNKKNHLKISNPLTQEWVYMRRSLIPSLLTVINQNQGENQQIKIFELSQVYLKKNRGLPEEKLNLVIAQNGKNQFYQLKGIMEVLLKTLGIKEYQLKPETDSWLFNPAKTAKIVSQAKILGSIGEIKAKIINNFELKTPVVLLELDFEAIADLSDPKKSFTSLPLYPPVIEDLTFIIEPRVYYSQIIKLIKSISSIIQKIELIDSYKKSKTFRIIYQHPRKNLSSKEVSQVRKAIINQVRKKGLGKLRSA